MNKEEQLNVALVGAALLLGLALYATWPHIFKAPPSARVSASAFCANLLPAIPLEGKVAYAEDIETGRVLYEKNADAQMPLASLTKVMTVLSASDVLKNSDIVTITEDALTPEGDSGLERGERWDSETLIDFTLLTSSNDGAHALALAAEKKLETASFDPNGSKTMGLFIKRMNDKAAALGLTQTFFVDDTGLDISTNNAGAYGSARDIAKLFSYIIHTNPGLIEGTTAQSGVFVSKSGITHTGKNTSMVISGLEGAIGAKTGFTDLAGGNLALVYEPIPKRPLVLVILGSTRDGRDTDMKTLAAAAKITLRHAILCETSAKI